MEYEPYDFVLPPERIAERPVRPYHDAQLLVLAGEELAEATFFDLCRFVAPGDLIVFNNTRVIPARLFGRLPTGGAVEVLLLEERGGNVWHALGKPLKKFKPGIRLDFGLGLCGEVAERSDPERVTLRFGAVDPGLDEAGVAALIRSVGVMPVPPYIRGGRGDASDVVDYQTTFAAVEGSVAAPTASLHFTPELLDRLKAHGCPLEYITLHVGAPSFSVVWSSDGGAPVLIPPGQESYRYSAGALGAIAACRERGGRVVAVGTTVVRALESMARHAAGRDGEWYETTLFIRPGFDFKVVDRLVTNFHQPRSTHLLLVEAFIGRAPLDRIYTHALASQYRFFSYGDGMLLDRRGPHAPAPAR